MGRFTADVYIDDLTIVLDIDVVPDNYTGHDLILGGELSDFVEVCIRRRKATLKKIDGDVPESATVATKTEDKG